MSVLMTEDKKELIITCDCHCENAFHIIIDDDFLDDVNRYAFMSFMKGNVVADSTLSVWSVWKIKIKRIWRILRNKDYFYSDILMTPADLRVFKEYINQI